MKYGYNSLDFETYLNDTLVLVDNVAHANNDLIASHIVTCFLASSSDKTGVWASTIGSGWTSISGSIFSTIYVSISVFSISPSIIPVSSNISVLSSISVITSPVHSNTYIISHVSSLGILVSSFSDLNRSCT